MSRNWNWTRHEDQNSARNNAKSVQNAVTNLPASAASYFAPISSFYQEMDRVFDQAFRNLGVPSVFGANPWENIFNPKVNIASTDSEYTIEVEVAGLSENDIRIDVARDGQLCICGEKRLENNNQEKDFHRVERSYGSFSRTLSLPEDVDQDNIEASFNNGILTITAPRSQDQAAQPRRIEVKAGESDRNKRNRQDNQKQEQGASASGQQPKRVA